MKTNILHYELYKDIFGIYKEIQNINPGFRLYFNKFKKRFEIINIYNNFEICKVFDCIFGINLSNLRFLRIENYNKILSFIDDSNDKLEHKNHLNNQEQSKYIFKEFFNLTNRSSQINKQDINKIIGAAKC